MGRRGEEARYRLEHVGELTPENLLDWAVVLGNGVLLAVAVYQLGGFPPLGRPLVVLGALAGLLLLLHAFSWWVRDPPEVHPWGWVALPFLLWVAGRAGWHHPAPWVAERQGWVWMMAAVVWWTVLHHARKKEQVAVLLAFPVAAMGLALVAALYQLLHQPDWLPLGRVRVSPGLEALPVSGTFGQPVGLAGFLELLFPLLVLAAGARRLSPMLRGLLGFLAVAALVGWLGSRDQTGAWVLGPVLVLLPFFLLRRSLPQILAATVVASVLVAVSPWLIHGSGNSLEATPAWGHAYGVWLAEQGAIGVLLLVGPVVAVVLGSAWIWLKTPFLAVPLGGETRVTPQAKILLGWLLLAGLAATVRLGTDDLLALPAYLFLLALMAALAAQRLTKGRWRIGPRGRWVGAGVALVLAGAVALRAGVVGQGTFEYFLAQERLQVYLEDPRGEHMNERFLEQTRRGFERALVWLPHHAEARAHLGLTLLHAIRFRPERRLELAQRALDEIETARHHSPHWRFEIYRALALERLGRPHGEVVAASQAAVAVAPQQPDAWYQLAAALAQQPDRQAEALVALEQVFTLDPRHENGRILASRLTSP